MLATDHTKRLIETTFPVRAVSLDSVHDKSIRHGHLSTLHIWPARRPLPACRATLAAALLPDPGNQTQRDELYTRLAGRVTEDGPKPRTEEGILHWGRENGSDLDFFREEICKAYGGRAPKVLDPFSGGGAIPFEAMRLGCETYAADLNPVAWFILKCALNYPQKLAGQTRLLPDWIRPDTLFITDFLRAKGLKGRRLQLAIQRLGGGPSLWTGHAVSLSEDILEEADLAWHVRAWGQHVLQAVRTKLADQFPVYAEWDLHAEGYRRHRQYNPHQPCGPGQSFDAKPLRRVELDAGGVPLPNDVLNISLDNHYLMEPSNPRWIVKPVVAYLWARTATCRTCRATVPLLKTVWLCKKKGKQIRLVLQPNEDRNAVSFRIQRIESDAPITGELADVTSTVGNRRVECPLCQARMKLDEVRQEAIVQGFGTVMTAVVVDGPQGKEYREPTSEEQAIAQVSTEKLEALYSEIPFGLPTEQIPRTGPGASYGFPAITWGLRSWEKFFTSRQLLVLGTLLIEIRKVAPKLAEAGYPLEWQETIQAYLALVLSKFADYSSSICTWHNSGEKLGHTFAKFALPITWDFCEVNPFSERTGGFSAMLEWAMLFVEHALAAVSDAPRPRVEVRDAITPADDPLDLIITDPPYYDAIPYSDLMDFFHVWLRRSCHGLSPEMDKVFQNPTGPKWDREQNQGELIDDANRFDGDREQSRQNYEDGMARAFAACHQSLVDSGRLVVVFANKQPEAWETLVSALIRAGFEVTASWPIETEGTTRMRAQSSAALSSSIWMVCRKRPKNTQPGWAGPVLEEMQREILSRLRDFWDAGIRGPDFVWSATGPALEYFSRYPVVRTEDPRNPLMPVSEYLRHVRRTVVDFMVGLVLSDDGQDTPEETLDDVTIYYLLHRRDYGMEPAPSGAVILYAISCNLSDTELTGSLNILAKVKGSTMGLRAWNQRQIGDRKGGKPAGLIDHLHHLMQVWRTGEIHAVNDYIVQAHLQRNTMFHRVVQAVLELAAEGSEERSVLEAVANHLRADIPDTSSARGPRTLFD